MSQYLSKILYHDKIVLGSHYTFLSLINIPSNKFLWNLFANNQSMRTKWLNFVRSQSFKDQTAEAFLTAVYMRIHPQGCRIHTQAQIKQMIPAFVSSAVVTVPAKFIAIGEVGSCILKYSFI